MPWLEQCMRLVRSSVLLLVRPAGLTDPRGTHHASSVAVGGLAGTACSQQPRHNLTQASQVVEKDARGSQRGRSSPLQRYDRVGADSGGASCEDQREVLEAPRTA